VSCLLAEFDSNGLETGRMSETSKHYLVTGGAGYIGSQTVRLLVREGHRVTVVDNLSTGHAEALPSEVTLVEAALSDGATITKSLDGVDAVLHFAANIEAGESVHDPARFWANNLNGTLSLLNSMQAAGVKKLVFSSTAAVYGEPKENPIAEDNDLLPTNPYGQSKLASEMAIHDYCHAYDMSAICLRYFNAAGAEPGGQHGADHHHKTHLITLCMEAALGRIPKLSIFGTDYPTRDGTAVRDYIHVVDLAAAHIDALRVLGEKGCRKYNLGNGLGYSVKEVVALAKEVTGVDFPTVLTERREGDPAELIASSVRAQSQLHWKPAHAELRKILQDAWDWHSSHPNGYSAE